MKNITKILLAGTLALGGLAGCSENITRGVYEGYPMEYKKINWNGNTVITIYSNEFMNPRKIEFLDILSNGELDIINVTNIGKEDPLGKFACFEVGQKLVGDFLIFNQGFKQGKKVKYFKEGKEIK